MGEAESKDVEAIRALVEFTWKQENIEKISGEIKEHIERITDEVKKSVEERIVNEIVQGIEERVTGEIKREVKRDLGKRVTESQKRARLYLALCMTFASIALGVIIAALVGLLG